MAKIDFPQTRSTLPDIIQYILNKKNSMVFKPDNRPSKNWVTRFLKRHCEVTNRVPEHLGYLRGIVTQGVAHKFHEDLKDFF